MNQYESKNHPGKFIPIKHSTEDLSVFEEILKDYDPEVIMELGTLKGGLTLFFSEVLPRSSIITFDIKPMELEEYYRLQILNPDQFCQFYTGDILKDKKIQKMISEIIGKMKSRKLLLYCDNGDKMKEIKIYKNFLMKGHMLGVHDWGTEVDPNKALKLLSKDFTRVHNKEHNNTAMAFFIRS